MQSGATVQCAYSFLFIIVFPLWSSTWFKTCFGMCVFLGFCPIGSYPPPNPLDSPAPRRPETSRLVPTPFRVRICCCRRSADQPTSSSGALLGTANDTESRERSLAEPRCAVCKTTPLWSSLPLTALCAGAHGRPAQLH